MASKKQPPTAENSSGAPLSPTDPALNADSRGKEGSPLNPYWKGRDFPRKPGSKRAKSQPRRSTSSNPAPLISSKILPPLEVAGCYSLVKSNPEQEQLLMDLEEFESFRKDILPSAINDVKAGMSAEEILNKYKALAAAKMVSLIPNGREGFAASKDILDRTGGKAVERKLVKHQYDEVPDAELDAILKSRLKDIEGVIIEEDENE